MFEAEVYLKSNKPVLENVTLTVVEKFLHENTKSDKETDQDLIDLGERSKTEDTQPAESQTSRSNNQASNSVISKQDMDATSTNAKSKKKQGAGWNGWFVLDL
jgi:hypothetical protein